MAMDLSWRDFAAIWGARLSSLIVLARFLQARPRFKTEPGKLPTSDQILRIVNPAKNMRLIRERFRVKVSGDGCEIGIFTGKSRVCDLGVPGTLLFAIRVRMKGR